MWAAYLKLVCWPSWAPSAGTARQKEKLSHGVTLSTSSMQVNFVVIRKISVLILGPENHLRWQKWKFWADAAEMQFSWELIKKKKKNQLQESIYIFCYQAITNPNLGTGLHRGTWNRGCRKWKLVLFITCQAGLPETQVSQNRLILLITGKTAFWVT